MPNTQHIFVISYNINFMKHKKQRNLAQNFPTLLQFSTTEFKKRGLINRLNLSKFI
jgi:hypothetical protein